MLSIRPFSIGTLALAALIACSAPVLAQNAAPAPGPAIEQQMTPEQFKAAGLDKLSADELANLNAWLNRTIDRETSKAAAVAKKQVEDDNRGFFDFGSAEPIVAHIPGEFRGFANGRTYTLDNGQVWRQIESANLVGVRLTNPQVTIKPALIGNAWYMQVKGYNARAKVQRVK